MDYLLLRFFERITAVLIGGMAIYLGFRLFIEMPEHKNSAGKFVLPWDISIVMTRIGPGVFFALFGVAAVSLALIRPLDIITKVPASSYDTGSRRITYMTESELHDPTKRADARALLRRHIAVLNSVPRMLKADLRAHDQDDIKFSVALVKLMLMKPVWGEPDEEFGDIAEFERWVRSGEPTPAPSGMENALALYRYGMKEVEP
ncbi:MAG: hypothetical protein GY850_36585 [bacterium]|nr:hypothetical protein [bacterium]